MSVNPPIPFTGPVRLAPARAHAHDAGLDLRSNLDAVIPSGGRVLVPTGVAVAIPDGHAGLVCPRSGLAVEKGVTVLNAPGVIDSGYRGEIRVALVNHGRDAVRIAHGERVAQLLVVPVAVPVPVHVDALPASGDGRGVAGFGSTGA